MHARRIVATLQHFGAEENDIGSFAELADSTNKLFQAEVKLVDDLKAEFKSKCEEFAQSQQKARVQFHEHTMRKVETFTKVQTMTSDKNMNKLNYW